MKFRRRPTDRELVSWLETGRPTRVDKFVDDSEVAHRLERLTELSSTDRAALDESVTPRTGFEARTGSAVRSRVSDLERAGTLLGLLGLGAQTARSLGSGDRRTTDDGPTSADADRDA